MIETIHDALRRVSHPRFFETERGFQGAFQANLHVALGHPIPADAIIEEEHQKRRKVHGIRRRPDVIVHVPTPPGGNRRLGNLAVFALKLKAGPSQARLDFKKLDEILRVLKYSMAAFVNIADERTHAEQYRGRFRHRMHFFAVWQNDGETHVRHVKLRTRRRAKRTGIGLRRHNLDVRRPTR